jgi:hypothetical protein
MPITNGSCDFLGARNFFLSLPVCLGGKMQLFCLVPEMPRRLYFLFGVAFRVFIF